MDGKVTAEQVREAIEYLERFEKGFAGDGPAPGFDQSEAVNGERKKLQKSKREEALAFHIKKAKSHQEALDKIEKGEDVEEVDKEEEELIKKCNMKKASDEEELEKAEETEEVDETEEEEEKEEPEEVEEPVEKSKKIKKSVQSNIGQIPSDLLKSSISEALSPLKESYDVLLKERDQQIEELKKSFEDRLKLLEDQPIGGKTIRKGAEAVILNKALSGEPTEEGKILLSRKYQSREVSNAIFNAWESCQDEHMKGKLEKAVNVFESSGGALTPEAAMYLYNTQNIKLID